MQKWHKELKGMAEYVKHCSVPANPENPRTAQSKAPEYGGAVAFGSGLSMKQEFRRFTVAAVVDHRNGIIALATAVAHPIDVSKFNKKIGKSIALGRARKLMASHFDKAPVTAYKSFHGIFNMNTIPANEIQAYFNQVAIGAEAWFEYILKRHEEISKRSA